MGKQSVTKPFTLMFTPMCNFRITSQVNPTDCISLDCEEEAGVLGDTPADTGITFEHRAFLLQGKNANHCTIEFSV